MIILTIAVCLALVVTGVLTVLFARRLLKIDTAWQRIDGLLYEYQEFVDKTTTQGILVDHPEIREFHRRTVVLREAMRIAIVDGRSIRGLNHDGGRIDG